MLSLMEVSLVSIQYIHTVMSLNNGNTGFSILQNDHIEIHPLFHKTALRILVQATWAHKTYKFPLQRIISDPGPSE